MAGGDDRQTLRELRVRYEAVMLDRWDRTVPAAALLHNLIAIVHGGLGGRPPLAAVTQESLHPYRRRGDPGEESRRIRVTADNFDLLRTVFVDGR